jgi:hypothetical protein
MASEPAPSLLVSLTGTVGNLSVLVTDPRDDTPVSRMDARTAWALSRQLADAAIVILSEPVGPKP